MLCVRGTPSTQPAHKLFALLPSGKRYRCLQSTTSRHWNSLFPTAVSLLNSTWHTNPHCAAESLQNVYPPNTLALLRLYGVLHCNCYFYVNHSVILWVSCTSVHILLPMAIVYTGTLSVLISFKSYDNKVESDQILRASCAHTGAELIYKCITGCSLNGVFHYPR